MGPSGRVHLPRQGAAKSLDDGRHRLCLHPRLLHHAVAEKYPPAPEKVEKTLDKDHVLRVIAVLHVSVRGVLHGFLARSLEPRRLLHVKVRMERRFNNVSVFIRRAGLDEIGKDYYIPAVCGDFRH